MRDLWKNDGDCGLTCRGSSCCCAVFHEKNTYISSCKAISLCLELLMPSKDFCLQQKSISWPEGHEWNFRSPQQFAVHPSNCQWECPLKESFRHDEIEWHLNRYPRIWYCDRNIQELRAELHIIKILKSFLFVIIIGCLKRQAWPKNTWELEHLGQHLFGTEMAAPKLTVSLVSGEEQRTKIDDCWPPLVWLWVGTRRFL